MPDIYLIYQMIVSSNSPGFMWALKIHMRNWALAAKQSVQIPQDI